MRRLMAGILGMVLSTMLLTGCESNAEGPEISGAQTPVQLMTEQELDAQEKSGLPKGYAACMKPRPEMCTMQYEPVMARLADGSERRFGNACSACAHKNVIGYKPLLNKR